MALSALERGHQFVLDALVGLIGIAQNDVFKVLTIVSIVGHACQSARTAHRRPVYQRRPGKSFDTFGPLGPWLVTADELPDPQNIPISLSVNGMVRQKSNTNDMIFSVAEKRLVSFFLGPRLRSGRGPLGLTMTIL